MPENVKQHIEQLKAQGAHIIYGTDAKDLAKAARPEQMRTNCQLKTIRRKNATGYHYFIANLTPNDICQNISLSIPFKSAKWFNPMTGEICDAHITDQNIEIALRSGESMILQTFDDAYTTTNTKELTSKTVIQEIPLTSSWTLCFTEEAPKVENTYQLNKLQSWETLDDQTRITMGTGVYTTKVKLRKKDISNGTWKIDLGDVRESARVYINGEFIGCAWAVPFVLDTKGSLKAGENEIRIEVTNLPANRIAALDRQGVKWRKMEEINVVDIHYKKTTYADWEPVPSGLNSQVKLIKTL